MRDGARRAAMMRFAVTEEAAGGRDLDDNGVAFHDASDAEADAVFRLDRERSRDCLDGGDLEFSIGLSHATSRGIDSLGADTACGAMPIISAAASYTTAHWRWPNGRHHCKGDSVPVF